MNHLDAVLERPTGPLRERAIIAHVDAYAREAGLVLLRDAYQNLMLTYDGTGGEVSPSLCLQMPLDQPGLEIRAVAGDTAEGWWHGPGELRSGQAMIVFGDRDEISPARVISFTHTSTGRPERVLLQMEGPVAVGDAALPEAPGYLREGGWVSTRAAYGLMGVAATLELFDRLIARGSPARVSALLTRGSVLHGAGALGALRQGVLESKAPVICLMGRPTPPGTSPGMGPVVLAGDADGLMDPQLTAYVEGCAWALSRRSSSYDWQRALAEDITSEAAVLRSYGHPTAAIALPVHQEMTEEGAKVDRVHLADYHTLIDLLESTALGWGGASTLKAADEIRKSRCDARGAVWLDRLR